MKCDHARRLAHELSWTGEASSGSDIIIPDELEEHLWACPECRAELAELRELRSRLRALGNRRPPENLARRTMATLRSERWRRRQSVRRVRIYIPRALAAGAAAAAIAIGGAYLAGHRSAPTTTVTPQVKPLVAAYADFRGTQPFGGGDGMPILVSVQENDQR